MKTPMLRQNLPYIEKFNIINTPYLIGTDTRSTIYMNSLRTKGNHSLNLSGKGLNNILSKLLAQARISLTELHRNTGVAIPTIKRMQSEPNSNPTISTLLPIADFFNISVNQLMGLEPLPSDVGAYIPKKEGWINVPIISWDEAEALGSNRQTILEREVVSTDMDVSAEAYALKVEEDNWDAFIKGSILIVDPKIKSKNRDYAIVLKQGQDAPTLKKVLFHEDEIYLHPPNSEFNTVLFDKEQYNILGTIVQIRMDLRD